MTYRAAGVPISVVACVTEKGIVRAVSHFGSPREMVNEVTKAVGVLNSDTEWTGYVYEGFPSYVSEWASGWDVPGGVYLFPWKNPKHWGDPSRRVSEREGQLLWRPFGWAGDRAENGTDDDGR